jgi:hypothetical protein
MPTERRRSARTTRCERGEWMEGAGPRSSTTQHMSAVAAEIPSSAPGSAVRINGDDETAQLTVTGPFQVTAVAQSTLTVGKVAVVAIAILILVLGISAEPTRVWVAFASILIGPWAATLALIIFLVVDPQIPRRAVGCLVAGTVLLTATFPAVSPPTESESRGYFYLYSSTLLVIAAFAALGILAVPAWRMWSRRQLLRSEGYRALRLFACAVLLLLCARFTIQRSLFRDHSITIVMVCGLVGAAVGGVVSYLMVKATRSETKRLTAEECPFELERMLQIKGLSVDEIFAVLKTVLLHDVEVVRSGATPSGMEHDLELRTKTAIIRAMAVPTDTGIIDLVIVVRAKEEEQTTRYRDVFDLLNHRFEHRRLA